jgi:hypothetical protein
MALAGMCADPARSTVLRVWLDNIAIESDGESDGKAVVRLYIQAANEADVSREAADSSTDRARGRTACARS